MPFFPPKPIGQVYPSGPPDKEDVRAWENAMVAFVNALETESRYGRVFGAELWDIASVSPPPEADRLLTSIDNSLQYWAAIPPPAGGATGTERKDANDKWWKLLFDGRDIAAEAVARINAIRDSGVLELSNVAFSGSAITADLSAGSGVTALAGSSTVHLISPMLNDGPITLNVGGSGAWPVQRRNGTALVAGDIKGGASYLLRRRGSAWRVIGLLDSDIQALVNVEASARAAEDSKLSLALRDSATIPLANIAGTGDAITADIHPTMQNAGITSLSAIAEVEYSPVATNTSANPTITIAGVTYGIRDADNGAWPAGGFLTTRIYKLRRRNTNMRVVSGAGGSAEIAAEATARANADAAEAAARIAGDAAEASARAAEDGKLALALRDGAILPLTNIAGTGDAITADLQATIINAGITTLSAIAEVEYVPVAANNAANPTITIAGATYGIRDADGGTWPAGGFSPARIYKLRRRGTTLRVVSGAVIPADMAAEATARMVGDAPLRAQRGTPLAPVALVNGVVVQAVDTATARHAMRFDPATIAAIFGEVASPDFLAVIARSGYAPPDIPAPMLRQRGVNTVATVVMVNGVPVQIVDPATGYTRLKLDDWTLADLASRLNLDGIELSVAPLSPDLAGPYDAWDVWQSDDMVYFTGLVWGTVPRGYMRRGAGDAWAVSPSLARLRLVYGDGLANAPADRAANRIAHVAALGDGFADEGLNGATTTAVATDIVRAGASFAALAADQWLARRTGALALIGTRSEAVEGATLPQLTTGQGMTNLARAKTQFETVLAPYQKTAQVDAVSVLHSLGGTSAEYLALATEIIARTAARAVHIFQPAGTWQNTDLTGAAGAVQAWRDRGTIPLVLVSPLYWCDIVPGTLAKPTPASVTMLAELDALAGPGWHPPVAYLAARTGVTVNVDFEVMTGVDLRCAALTGLRHSAATITAAQVVADPVTGRNTRLAITLSAAAAGTLTYCIASGGVDQSAYAGGKGQITDTWSATSVTGSTLRRHAAAFSFEV